MAEEPSLQTGDGQQQCVSIESPDKRSLAELISRTVDIHLPFSSFASIEHVGEWMDQLSKTIRVASSRATKKAIADTAPLVEWSIHGEHVVVCTTLPSGDDIVPIIDRQIDELRAS